MQYDRVHASSLPVGEAVMRLNASPLYTRLFKQAFQEKPNASNLAKAFAAFEQTLETVDSRFDDWSNNEGSLSASEERGRQLFIGSKARCFDCHFMEDFTDDSFRNIGLFDGRELNDSGRYLITKNPMDIGKFKTPELFILTIVLLFLGISFLTSQFGLSLDVTALRRPMSRIGVRLDDDAATRIRLITGFGFGTGNDEILW